jgi:predicted Rossmann fold nucleotide-binding protein DprA/Smf involved in DNA uptake
MNRALTDPVMIGLADERYPSGLRMRLGPEAPAHLALSGTESLLHEPLHAVFCSLNPPADLVLSAVELAHRLSRRPGPIIGGFQSPVEKLILEILVAGSQPVVICAAREIAGMRLPREWSAAMEEGRLLLVSGIQRRRRPDTVSAESRNRLVAGLASAISIVHAAPGGRIYRLTEAAIEWGVPVSCPRHRENEEIVLLGARPWSSAC